MEISKREVLTRGIIKENPVLRLVLGTCPTLAVTTSVVNGIGMGIAATLVLICSNIAISLLRKVIPDKVRIPAFITIIAGFVSVVQMLVKAYLPAIDSALGIYLPLIVVNCIILARAEMFASKNKVFLSAIDGLSMGIGFTAALVAMGTIREIIGAGSFAGIAIPGISSNPMLIMILPPGGFFVFGVLVAITNHIAEKHGKEPAVLKCSECNGGCEGCLVLHPELEAAKASEGTAAAEKVADKEPLTESSKEASGDNAGAPSTDSNGGDGK